MALYGLSVKCPNAGAYFYIIQAENERVAIFEGKEILGRACCLENLEDLINVQYEGFAELSTPF